jgi:hypothetical protein
MSSVISDRHTDAPEYSITGASDNENNDSSFCGLLFEAGPVLVKVRFIVNGKRIDGGKAYKIEWAERRCIS